MENVALAAELCPDDPAGGLRIVEAMTPAKRAAVERLIAVSDELVLWEAGVGPKPEGVIVCGEREVLRQPRRGRKKPARRTVLSPQSGEGG